MAGAEPGGPVGGSGGGEEEPEEVLQEGVAAIGGMVGASIGGKGRDESDDSLGGGQPPLEVEERE